MPGLIQKQYVCNTDVLRKCYNYGSFSSLQHMSGNFFDELMKEDGDDENEDTNEINDALDQQIISMFNDDDDDSDLKLELDSYDDEEEEFLPQINSVTLVGRVGQEPNPRYFDDGKVVLQLSLAVKRKYHPLERQVREIQYGSEEVDWFTLVFWGMDAEYAANYVTKGARIGITGSLIAETWSDRMSGEKRRSYKVNVQHLDILESKAEAELRMGNRKSGSYGGNYNSYDEGDEENEPTPAGSGGFFD